MAGRPCEILTRLTGRQLVLGRGDLVGAGRQPDLHELALLVRLHVEVAVRAFRFDHDRGAVDRLPLRIGHDALNETLSGRRQRERQRRQERAQNKAGATAIGRRTM